MSMAPRHGQADSVAACLKFPVACVESQCIVPREPCTGVQVYRATQGTGLHGAAGCIQHGKPSSRHHSHRQLHLSHPALARQAPHHLGQPASSKGIGTHCRCAVRGTPLFACPSHSLHFPSSKHLQAKVAGTLDMYQCIIVADLLSSTSPADRLCPVAQTQV